MDAQPFLDELHSLQALDQEALQAIRKKQSLGMRGVTIEGRPFSWLKSSDTPEGFTFPSPPRFEPVRVEMKKNGRLAYTTAFRGQVKQRQAKADEVHNRVIAEHRGMDFLPRNLVEVRAARANVEQVMETRQDELAGDYDELREVLNAWAFVATREGFEEWPSPAARQPFPDLEYREKAALLQESLYIGESDPNGDPALWRLEQLVEKFSSEIVLRGCAMRLWATATDPLENNPAQLLSILESAEKMFGLPPVLTKSTYAGVLFCGAAAAGPASDLVHLCCKRAAYERMGQAAALDVVPPEWADLETEAEETTQQGRDTRYADKRLESAKKSVAVTLLISADDAANGDFVLDPKWHGQSEKCFFEAVEKEDKFPRNWPAIKRQLTDNMETPPYGRGAEKWEADAQAWAEELSIPPFLFENRKT